MRTLRDAGGYRKLTMKTYTKTTEEPRLVIEHDDGADSPRKDDGKVGYFFTSEKRYNSPNGTDHMLYDIMMETSEEATSTEDHIRRMKERAHDAFKASGPKDGNSHDEDLHVIDIFPVYRYEHSAVAYRRGKGAGFDYSNCGFYIVTAKSISGQTMTEADILEAVDAELEEYTNWMNGEIYLFTLYDENGKVEDSCGGFYSLEDIREHLPTEWKDEKLEQYVKD